MIHSKTDQREPGPTPHRTAPTIHTGVLLISDPLGGVTRYTDRQFQRWAKEAGAGRDGTKYGKGKHTTRSYLTHHTQRIALAASRHEASHIILVINQEKGCLVRGEPGRWTGQRPSAAAGPPAPAPAAGADGAE